MTLAVKETIYQQDFQRIREQTKDESLRLLREKAFAYFAQNGFPTPRDEEWKYTNVAEIQNKQFKIQSSDNEDQSPQSELLKEFNFARNGFTALHLAFANVVLVTIPKETSVEKPIEFNFRADDGAANFPHVIVVAERGSRATIIESYESAGVSLTNSAIQIFVAD